MRFLLAVLIAGCAPGSEAPPAELAEETPPVPTPPAPAFAPSVVTPSDHGWFAPPPPACPPEGEAPATRFADVSVCAGVDVPHNLAEGPLDYWFATGQAWGDVDGDGLLDLLLTDQLERNTLLLGQRDGRFVHRAESGAEDWPAGGATMVDANQDGHLDVHLARDGADALLLNDGDGWFAPSDGGLAFPHEGFSTATAWADFDADGDLDAYTTNYACFDCTWLGEDELDWSSDTLWLGDGSGYVESGRVLGTQELIAGYGCQPTWLDFDNDGDLDLYVANDKGVFEPDVEREGLRRNALFRNDGAGCGSWCFEEVALDAGVGAFKDAMCVAVGDYDNDLDLDLYVTDTVRGILLQNLGDGTFLDATVSAGVDRPALGWGCAFADFDNDGWLDLYAGSNSGEQDLLWMNRGNGTFEDATEGSGADDDLSTLGVAAADYDRDGNVDLVVGDRGEAYKLYRNLGEGAGNWLGVRLEGIGAGGTDALGARVYVTVGEATQMREVKAGSSLGSGNDLGLHFGLGDAMAAAVRVRWPDGVEEDVDLPINAWSRVRRASAPP